MLSPLITLQGKMTTWKSSGYVIRSYETDHRPLHVHIFKDGREVARFDLENHELMDGSDPRHAGRIVRALKAVGLID